MMDIKKDKTMKVNCKVRVTYDNQTLTELTH